MEVIRILLSHSYKIVASNSSRWIDSATFCGRAARLLRAGKRLHQAGDRAGRAGGGGEQILGLGPEAAQHVLAPGRKVSADKDAPLKVAFPLGQSERLFPHLWAPSDVEGTSMTPEIEEALRPP